MKLKIYTLLLALCVTWSLQSCDNDDDNSIAVPTELQNAFASKYPNAANVKWETKYFLKFFKIFLRLGYINRFSYNGAMCIIAY